MATFAVDRAACLGRWRHRPLAEKLLLGLGMLGLAVTLPPFPGALAVILAMLGCTFVLARVPASTWGAAAAAPAGFLATGAITLLFGIGPDGLTLAPGGVAAAAALALRSFAALCCLLFLSLTTPATDLLRGFRRLGVPRDIVEVALLTYRFVFLLGDAALAMDHAQQARLGHSNNRRRLRSLGLLVANLLPRALARARRLENGLAARGWDGDMPVLGAAPAASLPALFAIAALLAAVAATGICLS